MEARHSRWFAGSVPNRENGGACMWQERDYVSIKRQVTSGWRRRIHSNGQVGLLFCVRVWWGRRRRHHRRPA